MAEIRATPQQRAAAEDRGGALLVAAAAGSGKTKVLVDRLMGKNPEHRFRFIQENAARVSEEVIDA